MNKMPPVKTMYRALLERDASFEGIFYAGVKTTGVFCRPTCTAKNPKPENLEYFASPQAALENGYRPCSRCRPLDKGRAMPESVQRLCQAVEQAPTGKLSDAELRDLGIDPSTARRQFQRYFGMTFQAYQRARRMGLALSALRNGEAVIAAQIDNGFESASGFWEAFRRVFDAPASAAERINCLSARWIETPLGAMLALANQEGLHLLEFVDRSELEHEIASLRAQTGCAIVPGNNPYLDQLGKELENYFAGVALRFTVPLILTGSAFERGVWAMLQTIPPGQTWSYTQLAQNVGRPAAVRAVGRANSAAFRRMTFMARARAQSSNVPGASGLSTPTTRLAMACVLWTKQRSSPGADATWPRPFARRVGEGKKRVRHSPLHPGFAFAVEFGVPLRLSARKG